MRLDELPHLLHGHDNILKSLENLADIDDDTIRALAADLTVVIGHFADLANILMTPETFDFIEGVQREAAHAHMRWPQYDPEKSPEDWYWLVGYLAGKALHAQRTGDLDKHRHHIISAAAALRNWHRSLEGEFRLYAKDDRQSAAPDIADPETSGHRKTCVLCESESSSMPCHLPHAAIGFPAGMGQKTHDWLTADCCTECHYKLDHGEWRNDFQIRMKAFALTIQRRIDEGVLLIDGETHSFELPF